MTLTSESSADDAESVSSAMEQAPPSNPGLLRTDLVAAILGLAPTSGSAPVAVPIPAQELAVKKNKNKLPPVKVLNGVKEIKNAHELLRDKVDLTTILNEEECKFLAEKLWIFTAQQLESVLHPQSEEHSKIRQDLIETLASSSLVPKNSEVAVKVEDIAMASDALNKKGHNTFVELQRKADSEAPHNEGHGTLVELEKTAVNVLDRDSATPSDSGHTGLAPPGGQDVGSALHAKDDGEGEQSLVTDVPVPCDTMTAATQTGNASSEISPNISCGTNGAIVDSKSSVHETRFVKTEKTQCSPTGTTTSPVQEEAESFGMGVDGGPETIDTIKPELPEGPSHSRLTSLDPDTARGSAETTQDANLNASSISSAIGVMEIWSEKLRKRSDDQNLVDINEKFFLDGPVSFLFPQSTRNFLKSAKIDTVFEFLCLKKTESGVIVDAYEDWRKKCGMGERPRICIARHLGALGVRLEALIGATCPVFGKERQWLSDHTIVLGGYAKDFFFAIGVHNAKAFVTETTKRLSYKLGVWRGKNGLPPLKGTGKVATVSGWKAQIREAQEFELHDGQILGDDWAKSMNIVKPEPSKTPAPTPAPSKKRLRKQLSLPTKKRDKIERESKSGAAKKIRLSLVSRPENRLSYYRRQGDEKKKPLPEPLST